MNILFVSTKNPYPIVDGHSLRTYNLIKQAAVEHNIFLLTFIQNDQELTGIKHMKGFCKIVKAIPIPANKSIPNLLWIVLQSVFSKIPFVVLKYKSVKMKNHILHAIKNEKIDIVHFDLLPLSQYCKYIGDIPAVMVDHNVESHLMRRRIKYEKYLKKIFFFLEWLKLKQFEIQSLKMVDLTIAVSENDKNELQNYSPDSKIEVVENGVDTEYYQSDGNIEEIGSLVFVGGMNWFPNLDAIQYFCSDILDHVRKEIPEVKLRVVGRLPDKKFAVDTKAVEFLGFVKDERTIISKSAVFIVPLRVGGGTRLKILNALSMGKAVVSTKVGCEGLNVTNGKNIYIADDSKQFSQMIIQLLKSEKIREKIGQEGCTLVKNQYDWNLLYKKMENIYQRVKQC